MPILFGYLCRMRRDVVCLLAEAISLQRESFQCDRWLATMEPPTTMPCSFSSGEDWQKGFRRWRLIGWAHSIDTGSTGSGGLYSERLLFPAIRSQREPWSLRF